MKNLILVLLSIVLITLAGCGKKDWYQDGTTTADLNRDVAKCEKVAKRKAAKHTKASRDARELNFFDDCMRHKKWQRWTLDNI